jgi:hypothetical protein
LLFVDRRGHCRRQAEPDFFGMQIFLNGVDCFARGRAVIFFDNDFYPFQQVLVTPYMQNSIPIFFTLSLAIIN